MVGHVPTLLGATLLGHYTMASVDSKFDDFCLQCNQFE